MKELKINQARYKKLIFEDYPKLVKEAEELISKFRCLSWDIRMMVEKDAKEMEKEREINS
jgi:hypothetical protein